MTGSPELLEYYLVEATEYVDAFDRLLGPAHAPDANALLATARALRGSSTMARVQPIAEISSAIEQIASKLRDGELQWSDEFHQTFRATVEDLRHLVRAVRIWTEREQARADQCLTRLRGRRRVATPISVPAGQPTPRSVTPSATMPVFLALQAAAIAAEIDAFVANPANRRSLDDALTRARTMQGIAGISDFPPLGDVGDMVERVGRGLMPDAPLSPAEHELFRAAAALLRQAAEQLRTLGRFEPNQDDLSRFARAVNALAAPQPVDAPVVRIEQLFYRDDGPHVVKKPEAPPTTPEARLTRELTTRAEHLRQLIADGRAAHDVVTRDRAERALRTALREIESIAQSFGAVALGGWCAGLVQRGGLVQEATLQTLTWGASLLARPVTSLAELERALTVTRPTPAPADRPVDAPPNASTTRSLVASGLAGLSQLDQEVLPPEESHDEGEIASIETLLYSGAAALQRAIELRDQVRKRGIGTNDPELAELFELLDLATHT